MRRIFTRQIVCVECQLARLFVYAWGGCETGASALILGRPILGYLASRLCFSLSILSVFVSSLLFFFASVSLSRSLCSLFFLLLSKNCHRVVSPPPPPSECPCLNRSLKRSAKSQIHLLRYFGFDAGDPIYDGPDAVKSLDVAFQLLAKKVRHV